jgi:large subunit ribosomal protein L35
MSYKQKTRKSISKRFRVTPTGKVMMRSQGMRHIRRHKSKRQIRSYQVPKVLTGKLARKVRRMLGLA